MKQVTGPDQGSSAPGGKDSVRLDSVSSWILGFGLVVFAGASDGAFQLSLFGQIGVFAWLLLALGLLLGLFPVNRPGPDGWTAIGLWVGLATWAALGLAWTESPDKTWLEIARFCTYGGVFSLALISRGRDSLPAQLGSVATGIAVIAGLALISRFQPGLFPDAAEVGQTLTSEAARLSFPLGYWNGLAALVAIGLPLLLELAGGSRHLVHRALATAAIPISILTIYFTFSRGGILAATLAIVVYFLLARDRLTRLLPTAIGAIGGLFLVLFARSQDAIREGLPNQSAQSQGETMLLLTIGVCLLTGIAAFVVLGRLGSWQLSSRLRPGRRQAWIGGAVIIVLILLASIASGAPNRVANGWESFKSSEPPARGSARLEAANGNGRYQYWSSAVKQWEESPLAGQGAGTYEFWWAENGDRAGFIRDAHSLYFQTLGESGLVGVILLLGFFGLVIVVGCRRSLFKLLDRRDPAAGWTAAATAGCVAFMASAAVDWTWQLPAVVFPFLLLSATLLSRSSAEEGGFSLGKRVGLAIVPLIFSILVAIPLFSTVALESSQEEARAGDLNAALEKARSAHSINPSTAAPLLQEAGLLEALGEPEVAIDAAREAAEAEPDNWRNWLILALIEARSGKATLALEHYQEAKRLNPRSQIFTPTAPE